MSGAHNKKSFKSIKRDKPKHSTLSLMKNNGEPKKGGAGGKGVWGKPGEEFNQEEGDYMSDDDGIYWEPEEQSVVKFASSIQDLNKFKKAVKDAASEFLKAGEFQDFVKVLKELDLPIYHQDLPYILVKLSFDHSDSEQKKLHQLLYLLFKEQLLTQQQVAQGVRKLYNVLDDLIIDFPQARAFLKAFVGYAVLQGFLDRKDADYNEETANLLSDSQAVQATKTKISSLLHEYFVSADINELRKSIEELKAPHLHFELVKKLISTALDLSNQEREMASHALATLANDVIKGDEISKGFTILLQRVEDLYLDVPDILRLLSSFLARAVVDEALPPAFLLRVDLAENDMGVQVVSASQQLLNQEAASRKIPYLWINNEKKNSIDEEAAGDEETKPEEKPSS